VAVRELEWIATDGRRGCCPLVNQRGEIGAEAREIKDKVRATSVFVGLRFKVHWV
jgi:hypothetical protein